MAVKSLGYIWSCRHHSKTLVRSKHSETFLFFRDVLELSVLPRPSVGLGMTQTQIICCGNIFSEPKLQPCISKNNRLDENIPAGYFCLHLGNSPEAWRRCGNHSGRSRPCRPVKICLFVCPLHQDAAFWKDFRGTSEVQTEENVVLVDSSCSKKSHVMLSILWGRRWSCFYVLFWWTALCVWRLCRDLTGPLPPSGLV